MNYGLIGCGRIARNHIKAARENGINIVAVCDIVPERMTELLTGEQGIAQYADYNQMLAENTFDFVAIATESGSHAKIALDLIKAKVNVIIEKPIALCINDANAIVTAAKENNVKVCACHQNRFNKAIVELRQAINDNRFGKLSHGTVHVRWNRNKHYYSQASWRGTYAKDGGALMNQVIHGIDLLRWCMGEEIEEVFAYTQNRFHDYNEAEDIGMALIKFKDGALGTVEGTVNVFPKNLEETLYIFGEKGTVKVGGTSANKIEVWEFADKNAVDNEIKAGFEEIIPNVYGNGHTSLYADMIAAIKENREPYVDAAAGKNALELVLAIYKSQKTGLPVKLPLTDFSTLDML